jgi:hypothetical protein
MEVGMGGITTYSDIKVIVESDASAGWKYSEES